MKNVLRSYCVFVLLDKPQKKTFRTLIRLRRRAQIIWLAPRIPFWVKLFGISAKPIPKNETLILWELEKLSTELEGKVLTLIPLSPKFLCFAEKNRAHLEISYRLERSHT